MGQVETIRAVVVQTQIIKEQDVRLTLVGVGHGKVYAMAKGAKKQGARLSGSAQLFYYGDFCVEESRGQLYVREATPIEMFYALRTDLELCCWASFMTELFSTLAQPEEPCDDMMKTLLKGFLALQNQKLSPQNVACAFALRALMLEGALPDPEELEREFRQNPSIHKTLSDGTIQAIRYVYESPLEQLYLFSLSQDVQRELFFCTRRLVTGYIQKELKSLQFLDRVDVL